VELVLTSKIVHCVRIRCSGEGGGKTRGVGRGKGGETGPASQSETSWATGLLTNGLTTTGGNKIPSGVAESIVARCD
jgi:hypothetical protein